MSAEAENTWLQYVKYQTDEICLRAVAINGLHLEHVRFQTPLICQTAVKQNGLALEFVMGYAKTRDLCIEAIRQNPAAIRFTKEANISDLAAIIRAVPEAKHYLNT
jgi:hypothetical protein